MEDTSIWDTVIAAALAALPGLLISVFAWFKARAAETEAQWDDEAVRFVEDIARRVAGQSTSTDK